MGAMHLIPTQRESRLRSRAGFTMIEMMIVSVLLAVVGGTVMSMLAKQQQFYRSTADVMDLRGQLRQASAVLTNDLRGVSSVGGDIRAMSETSIEFYYTMGSAVACSVPNNTTVILPPLTLNGGTTLTDWVTRPARGDMVFMFGDPNPNSASDDYWTPPLTVDTLVANYTATPCGSTFNHGTVTDAGWKLQISGSGTIPTADVRQGSTLRFARSVWYGLYENPADHRYYLGYCSPTCTTANPAQAVAGPFNPPGVSGAGTSGLRFTYYDQNGTQITGTGTNDRASVALISVVLRAQSRGQINVSGMGKGFYLDSLRTEIALRNRF
jgi:prepilin-type N-terminal cleavage/methylation domain-containing protein